MMLPLCRLRSNKARSPLVSQRLRLQVTGFLSGLGENLWEFRQVTGPGNQA